MDPGSQASPFALETLFILKQGRIRIFRVSPDGRTLTTAIVEPGTIFGEMIIVGQQMHDSFAEAMEDVVVCIMTKADVQTLLLGDQRIAARISETLGRRLGALEQRLSDAVFKSVPQRLATTLLTLSRGGGGGNKHHTTQGSMLTTPTNSWPPSLPHPARRPPKSSASSPTSGRSPSAAAGSP
jgi:CRP-like cAMP-binding protein